MFLQNLQEYSPAEIQTGPAARGDSKTINQHLYLLSGEPEWQKLYEALTNSIIASIAQSRK